MKKIIIIFIIVCCLLNFTGISFLTEKSFNFGEFWDFMSEGEKCAYVMGLHWGMIKRTGDFIEIIELLLNKNVEIPDEAFRLVYENWHLLTSDYEVRVRGISDLYKDPANTYIPIAEINILAHRKIRGESIESSLRELREEAFFLKNK